MRGTRIRAFRLRHGDVRGVTQWILARQQVLRSLWNRNTAKGSPHLGSCTSDLVSQKASPFVGIIQSAFSVSKGAASRYASPAEAAGSGCCPVASPSCPSRAEALSPR
jgi:hypothetical protein